MKCSTCPIERKAFVTRKVKRADVAVVVDFPTDQDHKRDAYLQGDSGVLARTLLEGYGLNLDEVYLCTALNCRPNMSKKGKESILKNAMLACRKRLCDELKAAGVSRVLCLGPVGFSALSGEDRNLPITKVRGRWRRFHGMDVLATFNPVTVMGVPDYFRDMEYDVGKFCTTEPLFVPPTVDRWVVETPDELEEAFAYLYDPPWVSCDVETTGFSPVRDRLLAVGFGVLDENGYDGTSVILDEFILSRRETWEYVEDLLSRDDQATVLHNAKFDLKWLRVFLEKFDLTYSPQHIEDTMLLNYCVDERPMGRFQSHSLKNMARVRCDAPDYDIEMGKWLRALKDANETQRSQMIEKMHTYLSLDCYYTARLYAIMPDVVVAESPKLMDLYHNLLMPGMLALCDIELHGIKIDREFYERTWTELQRRSAPILAHIQEVTGNENFNPNSPQQVAKLVYDTMGMPFGIEQAKKYARDKNSRKVGNTMGSRDLKGVKHTARQGKQQEGPTAKVVLKSLHKQFPELDPEGVIPAILEYRNLVKSAGTYVKGMLDRADVDDRIRGDFLPHGTATGRLSSSNPNLQNIPEASHTKIEIRDGFVAPEGYTLLNADYSQLELRIAAHMSGDEAFQAVYIEGRDVHQEVAYAFFKKPVEEISAYERYMAKCVNFGVVYDRGASSIALGPEMDYVEEIGGTRWTVDEVQEFFTSFFNNFPRFQQWRLDQKTFGYEHQYIESPFGRKRRFPFIPHKDAGAVGRQAVNTPIQGTASDFTFSALTRIHKRFLHTNKEAGAEVVYIVSTVHDSILAEARLDYVDIARKIMLEEMENVPLKSRVPFKAEIKIGERWGSMHTVEEDEDLSLVMAAVAEETGVPTD